MTRPMINDNGVTREMDETEYAEYLAEMERLTEMPPPKPTPEERLAEIEEALELLLSGVTE